jgi:hypothetical protein
MNSPSFLQAEERIVRAEREGAPRLSLSGLGLRSLPPDMLDALNGLRELDLSGNRLRELPANVAHLSKLEWLDLGNNRFEALPAEVCRLAALVSLDVSENRLTALPDAIGDLSRLVELSLYRNNLTEIPTTIVGLSRLKRLDLATNRIRWLPQLNRRLACLETLDLSCNQLDYLPAGLDRLPALRALNLANNRLTTVKGIEKLLAVEDLDLSQNQLKAPPLALTRVKTLRVLEARGNPFGALPETLCNIGTDETNAEAVAALGRFVSGGLQAGTRYFEPVSFLFGCFITIGGLSSLSLMIDRLYKRYDDVASVTLEFPGGTKVEMLNLTRKKALEIARNHEKDLTLGVVRLDLGEAGSHGELQRKTEFAADILTRVPGSALLPSTAGLTSQQFVVFNGPVYSPLIRGPSSKEVALGDRINISNVQNSILNVKSILEQVTQSINAAPIATEKKDELRSLVDQLNDILARAPEDKRDDADAVAEMLKNTMDKIAQPNPNKKALGISLGGIVTAAKGLADVLPIATKIGSLIAGMFGVTLPS